MLYSIEPEVSGGFGEETILDNTTHPPIISNLHINFSGWLNNDILECFPCYIITDKLKKEIEKNNLTGVIFDNIKVTKSEKFNAIYPNRSLPTFYWMKVTGKVGIQDFGLSKDLILVVSSRAVNVLKRLNLSEADLEQFNS